MPQLSHIPVLDRILPPDRARVSQFPNLELTPTEQRISIPNLIPLLFQRSVKCGNF